MWVRSGNAGQRVSIGFNCKGVYDHYDYTPEKAQALVKLASVVETIINPPPKAKVAQLDEHRRKKRRRS